MSDIKNICNQCRAEVCVHAIADIEKAADMREALSKAQSHIKDLEEANRDYEAYQEKAESELSSMRAVVEAAKEAQWWIGEFINTEDSDNFIGQHDLKRKLDAALAALVPSAEAGKEPTFTMKELEGMRDRLKQPWTPKEEKP